MLVLRTAPVVAQELYRTMPSRSKDYIRGERKPNGYQSLHETIYGEGGRGRISVACLPQAAQAGGMLFPHAHARSAQGLLPLGAAEGLPTHHGASPGPVRMYAFPPTAPCCTGQTARQRMRW